MGHMQQVDLRWAGELGCPAESAPLRVEALLQLCGAALDRLGGLAGFERLAPSCTAAALKYQLAVCVTCSMLMSARVSGKSRDLAATRYASSLTLWIRPFRWPVQLFLACLTS